MSFSLYTFVGIGMLKVSVSSCKHSTKPTKWCLTTRDTAGRQEEAGLTQAVRHSHCGNMARASLPLSLGMLRLALGRGPGTQSLEAASLIIALQS